MRRTMSSAPEGDAVGHGPPGELAAGTKGTGIQPPRAENPMWWPQIAASPYNPRTFGGNTLPKSNKLPKAGAAIQHGVHGLFQFDTLTSSSTGVRTLAAMGPQAWAADFHASPAR
jgi:hypothetical protein